MSTDEVPRQFNAAVAFVDTHVNQGRGGKTAIICVDLMISYNQLHENVNRFGNVLINLDIQIEQRVAMLLPDCPEWAYAFFGIMKVGAVAVPLNTNLKPPDYEYFLNDSRARAIVVEAGWLDRVTSIRDSLKFLKHILVVGRAPVHCMSLVEEMQNASDMLEPVDTSKDDMAFWLYSSGTTGLPKAAVHLHHDMLVAADLYARKTIGLLESDVTFSAAKLFFAYGLGNGLYFPLRTGGTTVLLPDHPTAEKVFQTIDRYQPTVFYSVPTGYMAMLHLAEQSDRTDLGRVRMCISAGETLPAHLFKKWRERFGIEILDGIGSTEALHIFISNRPGNAKPGSTGQLVPGYEARIVDENDRDLPLGSVGTLWIKGDSIAAGYWNKHEQTKNTFYGDWINTHDKFLADENAFFWYAGRTDDMMKVSGQAVWPADVESLLLQHDAVLESGVVSALDADGLTRPVAYVVLKNTSAASPELAKELQRFVKEKSSPHKYPRAVVFVDALPKTATGKIKRYQLRQQAGKENPLLAK